MGDRPLHFDFPHEQQEICSTWSCLRVGEDPESNSYLSCWRLGNLRQETSLLYFFLSLKKKMGFTIVPMPRLAFSASSDPPEFNFNFRYS